MLTINKIESRYLPSTINKKFVFTCVYVNESYSEIASMGVNANIHIPDSSYASSLIMSNVEQGSDITISPLLIDERDVLFENFYFKRSATYSFGGYKNTTSLFSGSFSAGQFVGLICVVTIDNYVCWSFNAITRVRVESGERYTAERCTNSRYGYIFGFGDNYINVYYSSNYYDNTNQK